jgi:hypothetical protein
LTEGTSRVDAFSDGVFAIAITVLVLEIRLPHTAEQPHPAGKSLFRPEVDATRVQAAPWVALAINVAVRAYLLHLRYQSAKRGA